MVYFAMQSSEKVVVLGVELPSLALWMIAIVVVAMVAYTSTRAFKRTPPATEAP